MGQPGEMSGEHGTARRPGCNGRFRPADIKASAPNGKVIPSKPVIHCAVCGDSDEYLNCFYGLPGGESAWLR
jgi:hypothetical protein